MNLIINHPLVSKELERLNNNIKTASAEVKKGIAKKVYDVLKGGWQGVGKGVSGTGRGITLAGNIIQTKPVSTAILAAGTATAGGVGYKKYKNYKNSNSAGYYESY